MNAKRRKFYFRMQSWAALWLALLFFAAALNAEAVESKPNKRRASNAKAAAAKQTKSAAKARAPRRSPAPRQNLTI